MACLAMVLAFFGRRGGLAHCRALCDPGRDGLTATQLADAARAIGLSVDAWVVDSGSALLDPRYGLPAIAHWRGAHFVVIERVSRRGFTIVDPALGRRRVTMRAFEEACSGIVLTFARGSVRASWVDPEESWWSRFIRRFMHTPDVSRLGSLLVFSTLALLACGLVLPLLTRQIVDDVEADWLESPAAWLAAAGALVVTSQGLLGYLRGRAAMQLQACFECQLTGHLVSHLLRLPVRFFQQRPAGPLLLRAGGPGLLRDQTTQAVLVGLDGLFVAGYLVLIALWSPPFAVLASTAVGLQIALLALSRLAMGGVAEGELAARADAENLLADVLRGMASVKAAGAEAYVLERWKQAFARQEVLSDRCHARGAVFDVMLTHLRLGATIALLGLGAREVLAGRLTVGEMLALAAMAGAVLTPFCSLSGGVRPLHLARVQLARVRDLFEVPSQQALALRAVRRRLSGSIRVERLAFRYSRSGPLVLDDISFAASAGATVAIVGRSGSGKSTLAHLLAGLHEPTSGRVSIDGWSLTTFDGARMRQQCGVVLQGSVPFNLTIRENVAFGRPEVTLADVVRAAKVAGLHDEIEQMPMGYDTCVLEGGAGLSNGQRQRLLIARAIAHRPALLILDDGLSQVDEELGRRVAMRLRGLVCTTVIVAHRIAETRDADLVLLLEQGRLMEQGSPTALLAAGGRYASLAATELAVAGGGYDLERTTCQSISEMSAGIRD